MGIEPMPERWETRARTSFSQERSGLSIHIYIFVVTSGFGHTLIRVMANLQIKILGVELPVKAGKVDSQIPAKGKTRVKPSTLLPLGSF